MKKNCKKNEKFWFWRKKLGKFDGDFIQVSEEKVKKEKHSLAFYLSTRIIFYILLLFFAIFFIWYTFFITTHKFYAVEGVSMMSTLNSSISDEDLHNLSKTSALRNTSYDAVYVDKLTAPKIFDVVVIEKPSSDSIIKRIMAMEGDYVTIAKAISSDGEEHYYFFRIPSGTDLSTFTDADALLEENGENGYSIYSHADWDSCSSETDVIRTESGEHVYQKDFYDTFLQDFYDGGDLEAGEHDGFYISDDGLIYVQVPEGYVFYMGDNRGHSSDSREKGFCLKSYIVGRAEFIVYNYNFGNRLLEVVKFYFSEMEKFFAR